VPVVWVSVVWVPVVWVRVIGLRVLLMAGVPFGRGWFRVLGVAPACSEYAL
jgi:hypothetical protein